MYIQLQPVTKQCDTYIETIETHTQCEHMENVQCGGVQEFGKELVTLIYVHEFIHLFCFSFFFDIVYVTVVAVVVFEMLTIKQQTVTHIHMQMGGISVFSFDLSDGKLGSIFTHRRRRYRTK